MPEQSACGTCTLCCKLLGIKELAKQPGRWCQHCDIGKGCKVYEDRPASCQEYQCMYLLAFDQGVEPPLELRPDKSKVVISPGMGNATDGSEIVTVHVDPGYRDHWKRGPVYAILCHMVEDGVKVLIGWDNGTEKLLMTRRGPNQVDIRKIHMSKPDANGVQTIEL